MNQKNLRLQKFFRIEARGTSIINEVKAGISVAFISMFVILSSTQMILKATGFSDNKMLVPLISVTLLFSAILTIFGGFYTKLPLLFISTVGFNLFITNQVISALSLDWGIGLGIIFIESILFIILSFTKLPEIFFTQLPDFLKKALPMAIGGMFVFFSIIAAKIITFQGTNNISTVTFRSPLFIIFAIGITVTYFLIKEKASFAYLQGFLMTLLLGMIIPNFAEGTAFYLPLILIIVAFIGWMLLYSILVDKHNKKSLEISLWIIILGLLVIVVFNTPADPIIAKPLHLFNKLGVFGFPHLKDATAVIGYPIFNISNVFKTLPKLIIPILSLLTVHWISYYGFVETMNTYLHFKKVEQDKYFIKKAYTIEGAMGILGSSSGTGFFSSSLGSIISLLVGGKTALTSLFSGLTFLIFLFLIPILSLSFVAVAFAPIFFILGIKLIIDFLPSISEDKFSWMPILITLIVGTLTMNIFLAFIIGLLGYFYSKITSGKLNEITGTTWYLLFILVIWSFLSFSIPFLVL